MHAIANKKKELEQRIKDLEWQVEQLMEDQHYRQMSKRAGAVLTLAKSGAKSGSRTSCALPYDIWTYEIWTTQPSGHCVMVPPKVKKTRCSHCNDTYEESKGHQCIVNPKAQRTLDDGNQG